MTPLKKRSLPVLCLSIELSEHVRLKKKAFLRLLSDSLSHCGAVNLHFYILFLHNRRLNDNEISILEAAGTFKKLPNLKKMYGCPPSSIAFYNMQTYRPNCSVVLQSGLVLSGKFLPTAASYAMSSVNLGGG